MGCPTSRQPQSNQTGSGCDEGAGVQGQGELAPGTVSAGVVVESPSRVPCKSRRDASLPSLPWLGRDLIHGPCGRVRQMLPRSLSQQEPPHEPAAVNGARPISIQRPPPRLPSLLGSSHCLGTGEPPQDHQCGLKTGLLPKPLAGAPFQGVSTPTRGFVVLTPSRDSPRPQQPAGASFF